VTTDEPRRHYPPPKYGLLILCFSTLLVMTLLGPLLVYSEAPLTGEGNPVRQVIYGLVMIGAVIGVGPADWRRVTAVPTLILVALAWCWASVAWSIDPGITIRRLALTTLVIWSIFIMVRQLGYERVVGIITIALTAVLVVNYAAVLLFPDYGVHQANARYDKDLIGDWRGIMQHKNFAGATCALLIPFMVFAARRVPLVLRAAAIAASLIFLYFSQSKTSMGIVGIGILAGFVYLRYTPRMRALMIPVALIVAVVGILIYNVYRDPVALLLRDPTAFTGRTVIWQMLFKYIADHPWLGTGFGAFWNIGPKSPVYTYGVNWITDVVSGHNGFLDLVAQIGIPGLILVLAATVVWPFARLVLPNDIPNRRGALIIALIIFCIAHNGTESSLFDRDSLVNVFLMCAIALIPAALAEAERAAARGDNTFAAFGLKLG
jgi:exopolysaccharide production protein ExoQ